MFCVLMPQGRGWEPVFMLFERGKSIQSPSSVAGLNYTVTELEALATVEAVLHFDFYLYGVPVTIYTDHKACESLLKSSRLNKRLTRMALKLQDRDLIIVYKPGKLNSNADGLSWQDWMKTSQRLLLVFISHAQWGNWDEDLTASPPGVYQPCPVGQDWDEDLTASPPGVYQPCPVGQDWDEDLTASPPGVYQPCPVGHRLSGGACEGGDKSQERREEDEEPRTVCVYVCVCGS